MISFPARAMMLASLLSGAAYASEPLPVPRCPPTSRFDVTAEASEVTPDVCVSADEPTTFLFDSRIAPGAVEVQPEGRLVDWSQGKEGLTVTVMPREDYLSGERIRVTVKFADGILPASASFWLVGHADRGTRRVEVFRQPRPADSFKREATDAQAEARQCREEKVQLLSERQEPGGLMGTAWLAQGGDIASKALGILKRSPANALVYVGGKAYSFTRLDGVRAISLSVFLRLLNPGGEPWAAVGASLTDSTGERVDLAAFQPVPIAPSREGNVVVGTERDPGQLACPCTVKLWDAPGTRVVTLGNITFPDGPKAGH